MYNPRLFQVENQDEVFRLIDKNPLATVITVAGDDMMISHLPLVATKTDQSVKLIGHFAKANPHWKMIESLPAKVIFQGVQGYITPSWYADHDVPTWNYSVVHMQGSAKLLTSYEETVSALKILSQHMESGRANPWEFGLPDDLADPKVLLSAIVAFEIDVTKIEAKFKLSQNRKQADFDGVIKGLESEGGERQNELRDLMLRHRKS